MSPKEILQEQFIGGVLLLMDGLVANLVDFIKMSQHEAEQAALEMLDTTAKMYKEG